MRRRPIKDKRLVKKLNMPVAQDRHQSQKETVLHVPGV